MTRPKVLGALAVLLYVPHVIWHIADHSAWDLLWVCNVALPLLALGCFLQNARLCVIAFLFLVYGTPLWLLDTVSGGTFSFGVGFAGISVGSDGSGSVHFFNGGGAYVVSNKGAVEPFPAGGPK